MPASTRGQVRRRGAGARQAEDGPLQAGKSANPCPRSSFFFRGSRKPPIPGPGSPHRGPRTRTGVDTAVRLEDEALEAPTQPEGRGPGPRPSLFRARSADLLRDLLFIRAASGSGCLRPGARTWSSPSLSRAERGPGPRPHFPGRERGPDPRPLFSAPRARTRGRPSRFGATSRDLTSGRVACRAPCFCGGTRRSHFPSRASAPRSPVPRSSPGARDPAAADLRPGPWNPFRPSPSAASPGSPGLSTLHFWHSLPPSAKTEYFSPPFQRLM
jgi:hypothetical protein